MDCKESDTTEWLSLSLCFQATWLIHFWWLQIAWNHDFCSFHITAYPLFLFHSFLKKIFFFVFFNVDNFKVFTEFATYCFCCMFWLFGHKACVISACTNQGLSWHRFHWKVKSTTGPPEKSLKWVFCRSVGVWEGCAVLSRFSCVQLFVIAWTIALQAPLSMGFPRQEYWRGLPFPPPGDLPSPGIEPGLLYWQSGSLPPSHQGTPLGRVQRLLFTCSLGPQRAKHNLATKQLCLKEKSCSKF